MTRRMFLGLISMVSLSAPGSVTSQDVSPALSEWQSHIEQADHLQQQLRYHSPDVTAEIAHVAGPAGGSTIQVILRGQPTVTHSDQWPPRVTPNDITLSLAAAKQLATWILSL